MANINNAKLAIQINLPGGKVKVDVTGAIVFTSLERFLMQNGLRFKLDCKLYGNDLGSDPHLYTFTKIIRYPDSTPATTEPYAFSETIDSSKLNEDGFWGGYTDEVYAVVTLTNLEDGIKKTKRSNEISHNF